MSALDSTIVEAPLRLLFAGIDASLADELAAALGTSATMAVVETTASALERVSAQEFDAVIVQPRLAHGSGNALLGSLKREHPKLIRCLLLDDGRDAPGLAALENLHRLLYNPVDAQALLVSLRAVLALRKRLESPFLAEAIGRIGRLPPPPALSLELMRRTENLEVSAREVAGLVESDPVLAAKVLRLCNSAMYSGGRRIDDIHNAVVWLGNLTLRRLVMAGEIFGAGRSRPEAPEREQLRRQSLVASRFAARLLPGPRADLAATAALLAGVGQMLPDVRLPWLEPSAHQTQWPTYAEAGAYLLSLWGLPSALVEAAALHPTPVLAGEQGLDVVGACHIAWAHVSDMPLDEAWVESLGLSDQRESWQVLADELAALET